MLRIKVIAGAVLALLVLGLILSIRGNAERDLLIRQGKARGDSLDREVKVSLAKLLEARKKAEQDSASLLIAKGAVRAATGHADAATATLVSERDRALAILADTASTVDTLRASLGRMTVKVDSLVTAHAKERLTWEADTAKYEASLRSQALVIKGLDDLVAEKNKQIQNRDELLKLQKPPGLLSRVGSKLPWIGLGALIDHYASR